MRRTGPHGFASARSLPFSDVAILETEPDGELNVFQLLIRRSLRKCPETSLDAWDPSRVQHAQPSPSLCHSHQPVWPAIEEQDLAVKSISDLKFNIPDKYLRNGL